MCLRWRFSSVGAYSVHCRSRSWICSLIDSERRLATLSIRVGVLLFRCHAGLWSGEHWGCQLFQRPLAISSLVRLRTHRSVSRVVRRCLGQAYGCTSGDETNTDMIPTATPNPKANFESWRNRCFLWSIKYLATISTIKPGHYVGVWIAINDFTMSRKPNIPSRRKVLHLPCDPIFQA